MDRAQRVIEALDILGKAEPESDKPNRRTELEHKACRAAISAWSHLKGEAGLKPQSESKSNRKGANQTRRAAGDEKVPTSNLTVPKFVAPVDAVKFFDRISADLLSKAVNGNAMTVPVAIKTAVQDFRKAIRSAVQTANAGAKRAVKAKANRGTVSAATIAARQQNGAGNGATPPVQ